MEKVDQIIDTLRLKIEQLVEENRKLKERVSGLIDESSHYRALSDERKKVLLDFESQSQALSAARKLKDGTGSDQARKRIDELVREIDKCINLLSR